MGQTQSELNNKFSKACWEGDLEKVKKYFEEGAEPNVFYQESKFDHPRVGKRGTYILHHLIEKISPNLKIIEYLLENNAFVLSVTPDYKNTELIKLLDKYNVECKYSSMRNLSDEEISNVFSSGKRIPKKQDLDWFLCQKRFDTANYLLEKGAPVTGDNIYYADVCPNFIEKCYLTDILITAFQSFFRRGKLDICDKILERLEKFGKSGVPYLFCYDEITGNKNHDNVQYLLGIVQKVGIMSHFDETDILEKSLCYCLTHSDVKRCTLILNAIKILNSKVTITTENLKAAKDSEKINFITNLILEYKLCNIFFVLKSGNVPLIEEYLNRTENKEINSVNPEYKTVLEIAEEYNNPRLIQILIQRGARFDPAVKLEDFFEAVKAGNVKDVKRMLISGVNYKLKYENKDVFKHAMESRNIDTIDLVTRVLVDGVDWLQGTEEDKEDAEYDDEDEAASEAGEELDNEGVPEILSTLPSAPVLKNNVEPGNREILA